MDASSSSFTYDYSITKVEEPVPTSLIGMTYDPGDMADQPVIVPSPAEILPSSPVTDNPLESS
jgi:hypothetical protein